jgi:membrane-associated phospholipid phosphatase
MAQTMKSSKYKLSSIVVMLIITNISSYAQTNNIKYWGDQGRYIIPIASALPALILQDLPGFEQLSLAEIISQTTTEGLKLLVREKRPNGNCCKSFPSGHASAAFTGASFVHFRYGFSYSIPLYIGSAFVAYSRVHADAHYTHDVLAGAVLGIASSYLSTTTYKNNNISFILDSNYAGIAYKKIF